MELFKEIMKCLPELRRHVEELFARDPKYYFSDEGQQTIRDEMYLWIESNYLDEYTRLYQLFQRAGIKTKRMMVYKMLEYHHLDWNLAHSR